MTHEPRGLLIVGHGTPDETGRREFAQFAALVAARMSTIIVEACVLEFEGVTIAEGLERCVARGARHVTVVPMLLFSAGHAQRDIPAAVEAASARRHVNITFARTLDFQPSLVELSAKRFREAIAAEAGAEERGVFAAAQTTLVVVGRGASDPRAAADLRRFAEMRQKLTPVAGLETCYLAMAEPRLAQTLARIAASDSRQVVVQPHLLWHGRLYDTVVAAVAERRAFEERAAEVSRRWIVTNPLGIDDLLVDTIVAVSNMPAT